jgi:hypothetical protein
LIPSIIILAPKCEANPRLPTEIAIPATICNIPHTKENMVPNQLSFFSGIYVLTSKK